MIGGGWKSAAWCGWHVGVNTSSNQGLRFSTPGAWLIFGISFELGMTGSAPCAIAIEPTMTYTPLELWIACVLWFLMGLTMGRELGRRSVQRKAEAQIRRLEAAVRSFIDAEVRAQEREDGQGRDADRGQMR